MTSVSSSAVSSSSLSSRSMAAAPPQQNATEVTKTVLNMDDENTIVELITILDNHRQKCEDEGNYIEAEITQKRLTELRQREVGKRKESLEARHIAERLNVEEAQMVEFEAFNQAWDKKEAEYEEKSSQFEKELLEKNDRKLAEWREAMQKKNPLRIKYSKELQSLRAAERSLAKSMQYIEAQKVKLEGDRLEALENEAAKQDWAKRIMDKQIQYAKQLEAEIETFRKRITEGRDLNKRTRQTELERLLRRHQNIKNELDSTQSIEKAKLTEMLNACLVPTRSKKTNTALFGVSPMPAPSPMAQNAPMPRSLQISASVAARSSSFLKNSAASPSHTGLTPSSSSVSALCSSSSAQPASSPAVSSVPISASASRTQGTASTRAPIVKASVSGSMAKSAGARKPLKTQPRGARRYRA